MNKPRLAISMGDPNGIGPEVVLRALADEALHEEIEPVLFGAAAVLRRHAEALGLEASLKGLEVREVGEGGAEVRFGKTTAEAGHLAMRAVEAGCDACLRAEADALVTAPISKEAIHLAGYRFPGHTEFLAERTRAEGYTMMMVSEGLRVGLVTTHVPVRDVADLVTEEAILGKLRILAASLRQDFGIASPRIAVLGLNPHAGDGGVIGGEEVEVIAPALERARAEGLGVGGPHPADAFFGTGGPARHDAVLAMYHDQGLVPFKALAMGRGVNFTAGLPIVRTSPDHGTAFDIAGQGRARAGSMAAALRLAAEAAARRAEAGAKG